MKIYFILFFGFILLIQFWFKGKVIDSKYINLFKFFFPSWCFFDESTEIPFLFIKLENQNDWEPLFSPSETKLSHLFYNPQFNLYLAYHAHMQQLIDELFLNQNNPHYFFENSMYYQLTLSWVKFKLKQVNPNSKFQNFSFKISTAKRNEVNHKLEAIDDFLISPIIQNEQELS